MFVLQALLTALLSGLFSGVVLFGLGERRDRMEAKLKRCEDLYIAVLEWFEKSDKYYAAAWDLAFNVDSREFGAKQDVVWNEMLLCNSRVNMLTSMFFPHLTYIISPLTGHQKVLITLYHKARLWQEGDNNGLTEALKELTVARGPLHALYLDALHAISAEGAKIANRPYLLRAWWQKTKVPSPTAAITKA